jgi:O-antigen/teichoic acid export membrane protein
MVSRGFIKSSLIYTLAGMLPMASAIVLLPLYLINLSTEAYGALVIYLVFTFLVQIVITFSFDASIYIHYHELKDDKKKLGGFVSTAFIFMLIAGLVVTVLLAVTGDLIFSLSVPGKDVSFYPYGIASVGAGVFQAIFKVHTSFLQTRQKAETFLWSNVMSFSLIALCIIIGFQIFPHSLAGPILGRLVGSFVPFVWVLARVFREFGFQFDVTWLRNSFSYNVYTFIYQLQQWVINQFDRILMLFYLTLADVGVYDFALKCLIPIELLMNSLHNSFYPKVVGALMGKTDQTFSVEINRYYHGLTAIVMLLISGSVLVVPIAIYLFDKTDYMEAIQYIPYLAGIYFFRTMRLYFGVPYNTLKFTKPLPVIYVVVVAIKIVLMVLLMNKFRIYGVIAASMVSAIAELFMLKYFMRNRFKYVFNTWKIVIAPVTVMLLMIVIEPFISAPSAWIAHSAYFIFCVILLWWIYRNEIKLIYPFKG